jgi:hypothetical protein
MMHYHRAGERSLIDHLRFQNCLRRKKFAFSTTTNGSRAPWCPVSITAGDATGYRRLQYASPSISDTEIKQSWVVWNSTKRRPGAVPPCAGKCGRLIATTPAYREVEVVGIVRSSIKSSLALKRRPNARVGMRCMRPSSAFFYRPGVTDHRSCARRHRPQTHDDHRLELTRLPAMFFRRYVEHHYQAS